MGFADSCPESSHVDMHFVSQIGASVAASLAGQNQAQRVQSRDETKTKRADPKKPGRKADEVDIDHVEAPEAIRELTDNAREETREDRHARNGYQPANAPARDKAHKPSIDLSA